LFTKSPFVKPYVAIRTFAGMDRKVEAAIKLIEAKTPPAEAARQLGLGRSTIYREMRRLGVSRPA
jgi:transcriptional regulator of acetoin/glycerol metabolism